MTELTSRCADAATAIFNLPDYRVLETEILGFGQRRIHVESTVESGCPDCGVIGTRRHSRRRQRVRDIPVAGPVEVIWSKRRYFCDESECPRGTFFEATLEVPRRAPLHPPAAGNMLVSAVIDSGRAATETAAAHGVSWWLVQRALNMAATRLPDVDRLRPRMLGIDEHRFRSVRLNHISHCIAWPGSRTSRSTGSAGIYSGRSPRTLSRNKDAEPVQPTRSASTEAGIVGVTANKARTRGA
ncbi:transposase family protein [Arthrobacter sp. LAR12-1-1.1]|uniref:transposase family protein n=1 Tax=Arthrobacter sp. LAR12-1-1.1 TaxID=3135215 RepID=UPI00342E6D29